MATAPIVVVLENPSLGSSLVDLLEAGHGPVNTVRDVEELERVLTAPPRAPHRLLLVASNRPQSRTVDAWSAGRLGGHPLVVVGPHESGLRSHGGLHVVALPIRIEEFLELIDSLLSETSGRRPA